MSSSSPRRLSSKPLSSASEPSFSYTAYRFLSSRPSSVDAGSTMHWYGPSTSNRIEHSELVAYVLVRSSTSVWYWWFV